MMDRRKERDHARRKRRKAKEANERRREKRNEESKRRSDDLMEAWRRNHPSEYWNVLLASTSPDERKSAETVEEQQGRGEPIRCSTGTDGNVAPVVA